jgi:hypothetical protein
MENQIVIYRIINIGNSGVDLYPKIKTETINFHIYPKMVVYLREDQFSCFTKRQIKRFKFLSVKKYTFSL